MNSMSTQMYDEVYSSQEDLTTEKTRNKTIKQVKKLETLLEENASESADSNCDPLD